MKRHAIPAAILALAAGPALAGSPEPAPVAPIVAAPVPVAAPGHDWTGFHAGAQLGYGDIDAGESGDDVLGGVHAGYTYDFGDYVLGGEIDYNAADIDLSNGAGSFDGLTRLKLKGGYDFGGTLLYGTLGAAYAEATLAGNGASDTGYFAGIGVAHMLTDSISLGGEAIYHEFDDFDGTGTDIEATTLSAKVSFHF